MNTHALDEIVKGIRRRCQESDGFFACRVIKANWPTKLDIEPLLVTRIESVGSSDLVGTTTYSYSLENAALASARITPNDSDLDIECAIDGFEYNLRSLWEQKFCDSLNKLIEDRPIVISPGMGLLNLIPPGCQMFWMDSVPRRSLFGRLVKPFKPYKWSKDGLRVVENKKYARLPYQVMAFNQNIATFLFPNVDTWAGDITWREDPTTDAGSFHALATVAARPIRPELGRVITILPKGIRGLLYRVVWKLLGIKP